MALEAIRSDPFLGHGFGQEWIYLSGVGSQGRAHNAYMTVCIELGFGGLALLLFAIYRFISSGVSLCRNAAFHECGALLIAMIATVCIDSLASSTLYWEKLPTIALSVGIALIGICERNSVAAVAQNAPVAAYEALPQQSSI
jgi:O-antigen ligase